MRRLDQWFWWYVRSPLILWLAGKHEVAVNVTIHGGVLVRRDGFLGRGLNIDQTKEATAAVSFPEIVFYGRLTDSQGIVS